MNVCDLENVYAWKDTQPGNNDNPTLYVVGTVVVPTPCYSVTTKDAGEKKSNPPIKMVTVEMNDDGGICPRVLVRKDFRYEESKFAGNHSEVEVRCDDTTVSVKIEEVS